jgi:hypothetical protein
MVGVNSHKITNKIILGEEILFKLEFWILLILPVMTSCDWVVDIAVDKLVNSVKIHVTYLFKYTSMEI